MILGGQLTPVSQLSGAFLQPPTPQHLQFAYYESSLVVEYLIETARVWTCLRRILVDLSVGMPINDALGAIFGRPSTWTKSLLSMRSSAPSDSRANWTGTVTFCPTVCHRPLLTNCSRSTPTTIGCCLAAARQAIRRRTGRPRKASSSESMRPIRRIRPAMAPRDCWPTSIANLGETASERSVLETLARHDSDALDVYPSPD